MEFYGDFDNRGETRPESPLALLLVAAMLPRERYETRLTDMAFMELTDADLAWADMIFMSGMTSSATSMAAALRRAKAAGRTTVLGGPHALVAYPYMQNVDCFVLGEAETIWDRFLADLDAGALKKAYAAPISEAEKEKLLAHFGAEVLCAPVDFPLPELGPVPVPRFDLLDMSAYFQMHIQTMRGCPSQCEFCDVWRRFGRRVRTRPVEQVLAELSELYRLGWRGEILFANDNLIGDRGYAKSLLTAIARWQTEHGRPFIFSGEGSLNLAEDKELMELCMAANATFMFVGLETPHVDSLREIRKLTNLRGNMAERVAVMQANGIHVAAGFIVGFDSDPPDVVARIAAAVQEMAIPVAMVSILTALPNTVLTERLGRESRLYDAPAKSNDHQFMPNFRTAASPGEVALSYRELLNALYPDDMKSYFERCATFLERRSKDRRKLRKILAEVAPGVKRMIPKTSETVSARLSGWTLYWRRFRFLCRMLTLPYGRNAFRFLFHIRRTRPDKMASAFFFIFQGHHFWRTTRTYLEAAFLWGIMKERLVLLHQDLGQVFPASTRLLGSWQPAHDHPEAAPFLPTGTQGAATGPMSDGGKDGLKQSVLDDMERRYRLLSQNARGILVDEYACFRQDVQSA